MRMKSPQVQSAGGSSSSSDERSSPQASEGSAQASRNGRKGTRDKFPYGDFEKVHRWGVLAAESRAGQYKSRAGQYKHLDVEAAAAHLHGMLEGLR